MTYKEAALAIAYLQNDCDREKLKAKGFSCEAVGVAFVKGFQALKTSLYYQATEEQIEDARRSAIARIRKERR